MVNGGYIHLVTRPIETDTANECRHWRWLDLAQLPSHNQIMNNRLLVFAVSDGLKGDVGN